VATQTLTSTSAPAALGRLSWMMVGPFALSICAISIAQRGAGWLGLPDAIYFLVLGGMLIGRRMEFRYGRPLTAMGEPASVADLRRYTLVLSILGLGIWIAAKLVANPAIHILG
jgi:hypothetical protein